MREACSWLSSSYILHLHFLRYSTLFVSLPLPFRPKNLDVHKISWAFIASSYYPFYVKGDYNLFFIGGQNNNFSQFICRSLTGLKEVINSSHLHALPNPENANIMKASSKYRSGKYCRTCIGELPIIFSPFATLCIHNVQAIGMPRLWRFILETVCIKKNKQN